MGRARLRALATAVGLPTEGLGEVLSIDPASQLRVLRAARKVDDVGEEDVDGVPTRRYRGTYRLSDLVAALPERERAGARRALEALERVADADLDEPTTVKMWIDDDALTRRMRTTSRIPAQHGQPSGAVAANVRLRPPRAEHEVVAARLREVVNRGSLL